jgi:hypothetical protein
MAQIPINISSPNDGLGEKLRTAFSSVNTMFSELYGNVVFSEAGKGLSSNDFTDLLAIKLNGISEGAEVNVQADLSQTDDTQDDFVNGQNTIYVGRSFQIDYPLITVAGTQDFTITDGLVAFRVELNRATQYLETANNLTEPDTFTQVGSVVTLKTLTEINNYVVIYCS